MTNKCPQCGFPEHEFGECPYARPKGETCDYDAKCLKCGARYTQTGGHICIDRQWRSWSESLVHSVVIEKPAAPSLRLLVVDFGETCVVKVEKGGMPQVHHIFYTKASDKLRVFDCSFETLRSAIDAHFAEDKPVPRIEQDNADQKGSYVLFEDADTTEYIAKDTYDAINKLARQAGATRDLEVYEPKGKWTQLPVISIFYDDWMRARWAQDTLPVAIWRYER